MLTVNTLIFLIIILLIISLFSATEVIISSSNKNRLKILENQGNEKAKKILNILDESNTVISTTRFAIFFLVIIGIPLALNRYSSYLVYNYIYSLFENQLALLQQDYLYSDREKFDFLTTSILFTLNFLTIFISSILMYSLAILYPRRIALNHFEKIANSIVLPMIFISKIFIPFMYITKGICFALLKLTGQKTENQTAEFCEDQVKSMLEVGQETGVLKEEGKKMINSIFAFDDKLAYEVMTPRTDVFSININDDTEEYIEELMELKYSRIPVYEDDSDNIIGILNIKDYLIKAREKGFENINIRSILRSPHFVPETQNIDSLFFALQSSKQHIAVLIDEYGGFSGIVTMEDIIEEVMGDIDDEYDEEELTIQKIDDNTFKVEGSIDIDDLNEELNINIQSDNSETLGGFLIEMLGKIPEDGTYNDEVLEYENCVFKIESVKEKRIEYVNLHIVRKKDEETNEESI